MRVREITLKLLRDLEPMLGDRRLSFPAITYKGEAMFLAMPLGPPQALKFGPGGFVPPEEGVLSQKVWSVRWEYPETWPLGPYNCELVVSNHETSFEFPLKDVTYQHPRLQRLSSEEFLVGHGTRRPTDDGFHVYSSEGVLLRPAWFGDVDGVVVHDDGTLWATYNDESALGELGSKALVRFNASGAIQWSLNEFLDDSENVYVLNALAIAGGHPWGCDWSTHDVINVQEGVVRRWANSVGSYDVSAISEPHLLLVSDYWGVHLGRKARFSLAAIDDSEVVALEELDLVLPNGQRLIDLDLTPAGRRPFDIVGRDHTLHVFAQNGWYTLDVGEVIASR